MEPSSSTIVSNLSTYRWEIPGKPVAIHLRLEVIDRMSPEILRGLGALKRRGAEVGGILLGRSEPGSPHRVWIEDFEPIPSEYLTGPSYRLSDKDRVALETAISKRRDRLSVVGLYRSHTRDELFMDDEDMGIARRYFADPWNVFLIVKPFMMRPSIGGFFIWENGTIFRESSYQQFPFSRKELGGGEAQAVRPTKPAPAPEPAPAPPPPPPAPPVVAAPPPPPPPLPPPPRQQRYSDAPVFSYGDEEDLPEEPGSSKRWIAIAGFLCLAAIGGYFGYRGLNDNKPSQPAAPPPVAAPKAAVLPLKLAVEEKGDQLDVTWDRNSTVISDAQRGVLNISDGGTQRELELTTAQLKGGSVLYSRVSGDVTLKLDVYRYGQDTVSESIRILASEPVAKSKPAADTSPAPVTPEPTPTPPAKKAVSRPRQRTAPRPAAKKEEAPPPAVEAAPPDIEISRPERRR